MTAKQQQQDEPFTKLRRAFPPGQIGKLPRKNRDDGSVIYLDYVGHGRITDRLLEVDPHWTWKPYAHDDRGLPLIVEDARGQLALWIILSVCGQERIGVGTCGKNAMDPLKELIGDALRNAAMRFGVALDLWIRDEEHAGKQRAPKKQRGKDDVEPLPEIVQRIIAAAKDVFGDDKAARDEWFRRRVQSYGVERLRECSVEQLEETLTDLSALAAQERSA